VALDAVGTLINPDPPVSEAYHRIGRACGSRLELSEVHRRFREAWRRGTNGDRTTTSEEEERDFWRRLVDEVLDDVSEPERCFDELFDHFARPESWRLFPDAADTLATLAGRGYRLAVASNFDGRLKGVCDGLPELPPVPVVVISSLVGHRKPSREFFRALAVAIQCEPNEILMVGDTWASDVAAAREAGLHAVLIDRAATRSDADRVRRLSEVLDRLPERLA
jgi:putative hydrolase of the HAD superfamily